MLKMKDARESYLAAFEAVEASRAGAGWLAPIRKAAIKYGVPYMTTLAAAHASALGIAAARRGGGGVRSLQEYHRELK